jgi:hypothetical protein
MASLNEINKQENLKERIDQIKNNNLVEIVFPKKEFEIFISEKDLWFISKKYLMRVSNFQFQNGTKDSFDIYPLRISWFNVSQIGESKMFFTFWIGSMKKTLIAKSKTAINGLKNLIKDYFLPAIH